VGAGSASALSGATLETAVLLVSLSAASVTPHFPVTAAKSWILLSAAGEEPQFSACDSQMALVSRSKTAV
jgi:hypothetical protein